jgi:hypothetical protein
MKNAKHFILLARYMTSLERIAVKYRTLWNSRVAQGLTSLYNCTIDFVLFSSFGRFIFLVVLSILLTHINNIYCAFYQVYDHFTV